MSYIKAAPTPTIIQEEDKDYPNIPVAPETASDLGEYLSARVDLSNRIKNLTGQRKVMDGFIHDIVNDIVFEMDPNDLPSGFTAIGEEYEAVQIQIKDSYAPITCNIKSNKQGKISERTDKILRLAEIFNLFSATRSDKGKITQITKDESVDGEFSFPENTFKYKSTISVDPTLVHPDQLGGFIDELVELGMKYTQKNDKGEPIKLNPVKEEQKLMPSPSFHRQRLKLGKVINQKIAMLFQNISLKLKNEEE